MSTPSRGTVNTALISAIVAVATIGGLLFGIATIRARVLPRWAAALLSFSAVLVLAGAVIPHPFDRIMALPMGIAIAWLGYSLLSERREQSS